MNVRAADEASSDAATASEVAARQEKLEGVGRVLAPILAPELAQAFDKTLVSVGRALAGVRSHRRTLSIGIGSQEAAVESAALGQELQRVEAALEEHAVALRGALDGTPLAVLRKAFVAAEDGHRADLLALLDLVLEDEPAIERCCDLLDYLTTLLATEDNGGRRRIAHDPATLTPRLASTGERMAAGSKDDLAAVEREFVAAAQRCESGELAEVVPEMRTRKSDLGVLILAPGVLRAVVYYNATVASALRARLDAERVAGQALPEPPASLKRRARPLVRTEAPASVSEVQPRLPAGTPLPVSVPPAQVTGRPVAVAPAPTSAVPQPVPTAIPHQDAPEGSVRWKVVVPAVGPSTALQQAAPRRKRHRIAASLGAAALAAGCAAFLLAGTPPEAAHPLSTAELRNLSPWLQDGYRDHGRTGSLFIGTVAEEWEDLTAAQRKQNAARLVSELSYSGIREILLYDTRQRLVVHHADGLPLVVLL